MSGFNYQRKAWHLFGFIMPLAFFLDVFHDSFGLKFGTRAILFSLISLGVIGLFFSELLRLNHKGYNEFFFRLFGPLMKKEESNRFNATLPYLFANSILILLFSPEMYFLSMSFLLLGDPAAAFFGSKYGNYRFYNGKSLAGVLGFFGVSILSGITLLWLFQTYNSQTIFSLIYNQSINWKAIFIVIISAVCAGMTEFFSGHSWKGLFDDNLTIPLVSGTVVFFLQLYLFGEKAVQIFDLTKLYS